MEEVDPYLEEAESFSSSFIQYLTGCERKKQAGMFSTRYSSNAVVDPKNRFILTHGEIWDWTSALIDYPRIRRDPNSKRSFVYGISFRNLEFKDDAVWGLIPFVDFIDASMMGIFTIEDCSRAFYLTSWCKFRHGRRNLARLFGQNRKSGDRVEFELDVGKKQMTIRAWSDSSPDPSTPRLLIQPIALEDNVTYCWAVSVEMTGSKCVVGKAWAREAE